MRATTGTLPDLTAALNEVLVELAAPISAATGTLESATAQLNALLTWRASAITQATGTLVSAVACYNTFVSSIYTFSGIGRRGWQMYKADAPASIKAVSNQK